MLGVCLGSGGSRSPCSRVAPFSKHRGEGFPLGGSRFQGCHGYLPFGLWLLLPANLYGTSSQAHQLVMSLNWHIVGHLTEIFQKSQMPGGLPGGGGGMGGFGIDRYITRRPLPLPQSIFKDMSVKVQ